MLVHQLINQGASDAVALYGKTTATYNQLQEKVAKYRNILYTSGIRPGDNIGLFSCNSPEFVYSYLAVVSLGAIIVPINFQLAAREIAFIIKDSQMKHLITMEKLDLTQALDQCGYRQRIMQLVISDFEKTIDKYTPDPLLDEEISENHPCAIIYTSGTTGSPKGAVLTHNNLVSNAAAFRGALPLIEGDNILCVLPMYHCFAWTCTVLNPLLCGASVTILETFTPKETIATIKEYGVTGVYGVPPMYNFLARTGEKNDFAGVRFFVSGGAPLPEKVAKRFREKYGADIIEGYGLSEASPVVTLNPPHKTRYYSIGKALPGLTVKIISPQGETMPHGSVGELIVKGPSVMQGYFNQPQETARALQNDWLFTGDLAYQDAEGYIYIVDRLKDLIISNGENIYPREIEELLYSYPGVIEAAVIAVPDELRGQTASAYLVLAEGSPFDKKSIREYLHANIAAYKIPRDFVLVDALPKNQTGKILKRVLREQSTTNESAEQVG